MPVMAEVPVFARVRERLADAPMVSGPKLRADGEICRCDCAPEPVRATVRGNVEADVAMLSVPERVPDWVGENATGMEQVPPGASASPAAGQVPFATE